MMEKGQELDLLHQQNLDKGNKIRNYSNDVVGQSYGSIGHQINVPPGSNTV